MYRAAQEIGARGRRVADKLSDGDGADRAVAQNYFRQFTSSVRICSFLRERGDGNQMEQCFNPSIHCSPWLDFVYLNILTNTMTEYLSSFKPTKNRGCD